MRDRCARGSKSAGNEEDMKYRHEDEDARHEVGAESSCVLDVKINGVLFRSSSS